jgi:sigma-54 specific flagellar transcriptional regulator A
MNISVTKKSCHLTLETVEDKPIPLSDLLCDLERATIAEALVKTGGVKARAADMLMLKRTTLVEKAKKYGFPLKK